MRPPTHATASLKSDTLSFAYDTAGAPYSVKYNGTTYYYITDLQGDVTAIVNGSGVSVAEYTYNAWGKLLTSTGTMSATLGALNPLRYRGYVYDAETGFYYLQSRYYDPGICRFISADAYASTGQGFVGYNMFAYCGNNPVGYSDATGDVSLSEIADRIDSVCRGIRIMIEKTFDIAVITTQEYKAMSMDTLFFGQEAGASTTKVAAGSCAAPITLYAQKTFEWWRVWENQIGIQINLENIGIKIGVGLGEASFTGRNRGSSLEVTLGINKIAMTSRVDVDWKKATSGVYHQMYVRTIPTAIAAAAIFYSAGILTPVIAAIA